MNVLWRLLWALPLVFATGIAMMLLLRRFVVPPQAASHDTRRLKLRESLAVSETTRVHLVELDQQSYLVIESERNATLQAVPVATAAEVRRPAARFAPGWVRRLGQGRAP
jgi:flagellar biogenesis protein FliO